MTETPSGDPPTPPKRLAIPPPPGMRQTAPDRLKLTTRFRNYFLAGILVTAPIAITAYLSIVFVSFIDWWVDSIIPGRYNPNAYLPITIPGLGLIIVVASLVFIGWFAAGFLGRLLFRLGERIVDKMPVVRHIYGALKQIFETVLAQKSEAFREVVLIEYPRLGVWSLGFITGPPYWEVQSLTQHEVVNVFIPTTPNPTSGYLLFVPRKDLVKLDITVEEGLKLLISGGIVLPADRRQKNPVTPANARPQTPSAKGINPFTNR